MAATKAKRYVRRAQLHRRPFTINLNRVLALWFFGENTCGDLNARGSSKLLQGDERKPEYVRSVGCGIPDHGHSQH